MHKRGHGALVPKSDLFAKSVLFISKLRLICESVKVLNIDADEFIRYFAWHGLNDRFKCHLVH